MTPARFIAAAFTQLAGDGADWNLYVASDFIQRVEQRAAELARESVGDGELLHCPWCGEKLDNASVSEGSTFRWRKVDGCCADGPEVRHNTMADDQAAAEEDSKQRAITAWNTRASEVEGRGSTASDQPLFQRANDYKEGYWDGFAASRSVGGDWLPIETCPRVSEQRILLAWSGGTVEQGLWLKNETWQGFRGESLRRVPAGLPTHWQPLPAPPLAGVSEGEVDGN